jgi:hypothetical protein
MFIVFAWHTPDYRHFADELIANLTARSIPHDVVEVPKLPDSWEANTMAKPSHLLAAMDRHPDKTIVLVDVDCQVLGDLTPCTSISGDVGFHIHTHYGKRGGARLSAWSGTVIVRPTEGARRYVEAWVAAAKEAPWGEVDQSAQIVAMGRSPGTNFTALGIEWCARKWDNVAEPIVLHDSARVRGSVRRITRGQRKLARLFGRFIKRPRPA